MKAGKWVILCVDDDSDFRDSVRLILEKHGYEVVTAASAEEGLKQYRKETPDLIIADLMMEEVDAGANFVKELKLLGNTAPVYMLSSAGDQLNMVVDYGELGLAGIFQKPLNPDRLIATLKDRLKK
jgi:DNA-binding response OmpR family regulator